MSLFDVIFNGSPLVQEEGKKLQSDVSDRVMPVDTLKGVHLGGLPIKSGKRVTVELYEDSIVFKHKDEEVRTLLKDDIYSIQYDYEDVCHGSTTTAHEETGLASTIALMNGDLAAAYFLRPKETTYETKNDIERIWYLEVSDENGSILIQAAEEDLPLFVDYCNDMLYASEDEDYFGEYIIEDMDEAEFKRFCVKVLEKNDFSDIVVLPASDDKRVTIVAQKDEVKYALLCKYTAKPVDGEAVKAIESGRKFYHCHVGVVLTNASFSEEAKELAQEQNIILWDKERLQQKIKGE